jgi:hypothetical protein
MKTNIIHNKYRIRTWATLCYSLFGCLEVLSPCTPRDASSWLSQPALLLHLDHVAPQLARTSTAQSLAHEQAEHRFQALDDAALREATRLSLLPDLSSASEEEAVAEDEASGSDDEEKDSQNTPPPSAWAEQTHRITLPPFAIESGSVLPRHRVTTEMGYLQCFLTPELMSTIAANTNLYAAFKQAPAGWSTTAEELWLFVAVHIFMGIVVLPAMTTYWEEGWRQEFVVKAFSRDRFKELQRYFHIAEPTPAGVRHTVIDKVRPLHDACLRTFKDSFIPRGR